MQNKMVSVNLHMPIAGCLSMLKPDCTVWPVGSDRWRERSLCADKDGPCPERSMMMLMCSFFISMMHQSGLERRFRSSTCPMVHLACNAVNTAGNGSTHFQNYTFSFFLSAIPISALLCVKQCVGQSCRKQQLQRQMRPAPIA